MDKKQKQTEVGLDLLLPCWFMVAPWWSVSLLKQLNPSRVSLEESTAKARQPKCPQRGASAWLHCSRGARLKGFGPVGRRYSAIVFTFTSTAAVQLPRFPPPLHTGCPRSIRIRIGKYIYSNQLFPGNNHFLLKGIQFSLR